MAGWAPAAPMAAPVKSKNVDKVLDQLEVGDIVTTRRTYRVHARRGPLTTFRDVHPQNEERYNLTRGGNHGSLRIDMVKKVAKPKPKPKDGEFVTGEQLRETMWKAGTTIRYETVRWYPGRTVVAVLHKDGEWHAIDSNGMSWKWGFNSTPSGIAQYELLHVA